jgi:DNA-binding transcriptional regulator LsrR (DeoR family)
VTARQLQRTGEVVVLATERDRAPAVHALLRSGLASTLITHRAVAEALLAHQAGS